MSFTTVCPKCDARLTAPDAVRGKKVKYKKCDEPFVATRAADPQDDEDDRPARPAKAAAVKRPGVRDEDDDKGARPKPAKARRAADDKDEDEPRPKAKKKGNKNKQGSPVLLLILVGVGALVLVGCGIGAYFAFIKADKPADTPAANSEGAKGSAGQGGPAVAGGMGARVEQHDADGEYRIKLPIAPRTQNVTQQTPAGPVTLKVYLAGGQTEAFVCTHQQLPSERAGVSEDQILDHAIEGAKQQAQGATAGPTRSITYQSRPGREVSMTFPDKKGEIIIRVILAGDRVIALSALGENATPDAPPVKQFFESLKIE